MVCALSLAGINPADIESIFFKPIAGRFEIISDQKAISEICRRHRKAHVQRDRDRQDTWYAIGQPGIHTLRIKLKAKK